MNFNNYKPVAKAVNTSGVSLVGINDARTALVLFNQGEETARISVGVESAYIELLPKQGMTFSKAPINEVRALTLQNTTTVTVWEA